MKEEYISISEFAKRAGVSRPTIYNRLDGDLSSFCKTVKGKKTINIAALSLFGVKESVKDFTSIEALKSAVDVLQKQTDMLQKQLDIKDLQIKELQDRLKESHVLLDQQQHLHAANLLEEKSSAALDEPTAAVIDPEQPEPTEKRKKPWQFWKKA